MTPPAQRTTHDLRRQNRAALLSRLYLQGSGHRNELARLCGLSPATVSNLVSDLIADGLVTEAGSESSSGGRPRTVLRARPEYGQVVGVDIGETHVRIGLFDWSLAMLATALYPIAETRLAPELVARLVLQGIAEVTAEAGLDPGELLGVGIGVPGAVQPDPSAPGRTLVHAPTLGWSGVPLGDMLRLGGVRVPLDIDNCARTLGQAEMWRGVGRGAERAVIALLGVGVGAALTPGTDAGFGISYPSTIEWGHTVIHAGGLPCRCGSRGCLEAYVGAEAALHRYHATVGSEPLLGDGTEARLAELAARADSSPAARDTLAGMGEYLGIGIANLVNLLTPDLVVLSGWAGLVVGPVILPGVRRAAERHTLAYLSGRARIEVGRLGQEAVALGAATLPVSRLLAEGGRAPVRTPNRTGVRTGRSA